MALRSSDPEKRREQQQRYDEQKREAARRYRERQIERARYLREYGLTPHEIPESARGVAERYYRAKRELKLAKRKARKKTNRRDVYGPVFSGLCRFVRRQGCYASSFEGVGECQGQSEAHHVIPRARLAGDWLYWLPDVGLWVHRARPGLDLDLSDYPRQGNVIGLCTQHHAMHHGGQMSKLVGHWADRCADEARKLGEYYSGKKTDPAIPWEAVT